MLVTIETLLFSVGLSFLKLDFLNLHIIICQAVHIGHKGVGLNVHQYKGRNGIPELSTIRSFDRLKGIRVSMMDDLTLSAVSIIS